MAISTMARLVEIAIVGPAVERGEALLPGIRAAAAVGGTIRARAVPRHADEEGAVMSVVGRPPRLAVGHQRGQIILQRLIVERPERRGIVEILAHRVGRDAALVQYLDRQRSEEHTSELQSLMRISNAVFCLTKKRCDRITTRLLRLNNIKSQTTIYKYQRSIANQ